MIKSKPIVFLASSTTFLLFIYILLHHHHSMASYFSRHQSSLTSSDKMSVVDRWKQSNKHLAKRLMNDNGRMMTASMFMIDKILGCLDEALLTLVNYDTTEPNLDYGYVMNDMTVTLNLLSYVDSLMTCGDFNHISAQPALMSTTVNSYIYHGVMTTGSRGPDICLETSMVDIDTLIAAKCGSSQSQRGKSNRNRCFLLKNLKLMRRALLQMHLAHNSVSKVLGICVASSRTSLKKLEELKSAGVVVMREFGRPFDIVKAQLWPWEARLKAAYQLLELVLFLSNSPLGSVAIPDWSPSNFQLDSANNIKIISFGDHLETNEPSCTRDHHCQINTISTGIKCSKTGWCSGYNSMSNLHQVSTSILFDLLQNPTDLKNDSLHLHARLIDGLSASTITAREAHLVTQQLVATTTQNTYKEFNAPKKDDVAQSEVLFDSSYHHQPVIVINDIQDFVAAHGPRNIIPMEQGVGLGLVQFSKNLNSHDSRLQMFNKIEDKDFPGKHDYYCPNSKAEWGCIKSLQTAEEAAGFCLADIKCKAFVTIPHLRKQGWIIAILKSDSTKPSHHPGINLYVKDLNKTSSYQTSLDSAAVDESCVAGLIEMQHVERHKRELKLMQVCGRAGWNDQQWSDVMSSAQVHDARAFKPAHGDSPIGGQMAVDLLNPAKIAPLSSIFTAKNGPLEYSASQISVYRLDRLLGIYKILPAVERVLSRVELAEANFPVDIGGNMFDKFKPLKRSDGSLPGVIIPSAEHLVTLEHYIKVPKLDDVTAAVTRFNARQLDDMEYLIVGHLASIPFPMRGHMSWQGQLLFTKTDSAFVTGTNEYLPYFYNCQFPAGPIALLRSALLNSCALLETISGARSNLELPASMGKIFTDNLNKLIEIVDLCVAKFGEDQVIINLS